MIPPELCALALSLLGVPAGPVLAVGADAAAWRRALRDAGRLVADDTGPAAGAIVTFVGERTDAGVRRGRLAAVRARLAAGAPLVLVDHNRPRQWWRRPLAALALLRRGLPPSRAAYPAARELEAAGFRVVTLRLATGERRQVVRAVRGVGPGPVARA